MRLLVAVTALMFAAVVGVPGCSGDDDGCNSDHDCPEDAGYDYVCEPDGCQRACEGNEDCAATDECVARRVEEGRVCRQTEEVISRQDH